MGLPKGLWLSMEDSLSDEPCLEAKPVERELDGREAEYCAGSKASL